MVKISPDSNGHIHVFQCLYQLMDREQFVFSLGEIDSIKQILGNEKGKEACQEVRLYPFVPSEIYRPGLEVGLGYPEAVLYLPSI